MGLKRYRKEIFEFLDDQIEHYEGDIENLIRLQKIKALREDLEFSTFVLKVFYDKYTEFDKGVEKKGDDFFNWENPYSLANIKNLILSSVMEVSHYLSGGGDLRPKKNHKRDVAQIYKKSKELLNLIDNSQHGPILSLVMDFDSKVYSNQGRITYLGEVPFEILKDLLKNMTSLIEMRSEKYNTPNSSSKKLEQKNSPANFVLNSVTKKVIANKDINFTALILAAIFRNKFDECHNKEVATLARIFAGYRCNKEGVRDEPITADDVSHLYTQAFGNLR